MDQKPERKKWNTPKLISLGNFSEIGKNDQISEEMKQELTALLTSLKKNPGKEGKA